MKKTTTAATTSNSSNFKYMRMDWIDFQLILFRYVVGLVSLFSLLADSIADHLANKYDFNPKISMDIFVESFFFFQLIPINWIIVFFSARIVAMTKSKAIQQIGMPDDTFWSVSFSCVYTIVTYHRWNVINNCTLSELSELLLHFCFW